MTFTNVAGSRLSKRRRSVKRWTSACRFLSRKPLGISVSAAGLTLVPALGLRGLRRIGTESGVDASWGLPPSWSSAWCSVGGAGELKQGVQVTGGFQGGDASQRGESDRGGHQAPVAGDAGGVFVGPAFHRVVDGAGQRQQQRVGGGGQASHGRE